MRGHLSVLIGHTELLREGAYGELTRAQRETLSEIESRVQDLGGMIEPEPVGVTGDRTTQTVGVAIITQTSFFDPIVERLSEVHESELIVSAAPQELAQLLEETELHRLIVDVDFDGALGIRLAEDVIAASGDSVPEIGLLSVYQSPRFGPRLGYAGVISRSFDEMDVAMLRNTFDLPPEMRIKTVGAIGQVTDHLGPNSAVADWSGDGDPDIVLVAEEALDSIDPAMLDELRGELPQCSRPVFIVVEPGSRLDDVGWATTVGAHRHLIRPPTESSLLSETRERFENPPLWLLPGGD